MEFVRTSTAQREGDAPTRDRVARTILENGPSTAADLALRLDLTPAAVRRHLDHLADEGVVESREQKVYGTRGRGRPAKVFALTEAGRDSFDQQYDDLAAQALRFLAETAGEEAVTEFARRRWSVLEARVEELLAVEPELTPTRALATALREAGFAASVIDGPVGEQLCQQHCPVAHVAHEFPQLCEAETETISRVLGRHVQRLATIAHGDGVCTTSIPSTPTTTSTTTTRTLSATNERRSP